MVDKTKSESLFERFCEMHGIRCERVPTAEERTPDYDIYVGEQKIIVEVKQIDLLSEGKAAQDSFEKRGFSLVDLGRPGKHVWVAIRYGDPQIRERAKGRYP